MDDVKLPKRVRDLVEELKAGKRLAVEVAPCGGKRVFWFEPGGRIAPQVTIQKAIELGVVVPAGDGLFGDSQTYVAA